MYLKNIKLSGFKSFVDPTSIPIRSNMNAIVGPNGCGKSNVVDAIRWVIGELSAKHLRGQTMSDVIFNGTNARKPVGKASIELHFENNSGRVTGEYAGYAEIAIRREIERDGQSSYYINGMQVRRRDVIDIFLGTGLGPRTYAIIEQGMISNFIEAKPEDLRVFIEEAAGISKYKERRRETENRIRHTHENLERINDIREELAKQLRHLKRQANAAERYKVYKEEERLLTAQIKGLQWQALDKQLEEKNQLINAQNVVQEELRAKQRGIETDIERVRTGQTAAIDKQNEVQKKYYGLGADIARLEQRIKDTQEQTKQWEKELTESKSLWEELSDNTMECRQQIEEITADLLSLNPETNDLKSSAQQAQRLLAEAEKDMNAFQQQWDALQGEVSHAVSQVEVANTKLDHYKHQLAEQEKRRHQTQNSLQQLPLDELRNEIAPLTEHTQQLNGQLEEAKVNLENYANQITAQRGVNQQRNHDVHDMRRALQTLEARYASLDALQQSALGRDDEQANAWLTERRLNQLPRLGQKLQVNEGWELAVETVLSGYFDAVCVDDVNEYVAEIAELSQGRVTLLEKLGASQADHFDKAPKLSAQVNSDWPFHQWFTGIYTAEDVLQAKQLRSQLNEHESVITRDGVWLGASWIRICKQSDPQSGVLLREQQLQQLKQHIATQQQQLSALEKELTDGENDLNQLEAQRDAEHRAYQQLSTESTGVQSQLSAKQTRFDDVQQRQQRLQQALHECEQQISAIKQAQESMQAHQQTLRGEQQRRQMQREEYLAQRDQLRKRLEEKRTDAQRKQQQADELEIRVSANENQLALLKQTVQRDERQLDQASERRDTLTSYLADSDTPLTTMSAELQVQLDKRLSIEAELRDAEIQVEKHNQALSELDGRRDEVQAELSNFQTKLEELRMQRQTITVRQTTIKEQLSEVDCDLASLMADMPQEAEIHAWQEQLDKVIQRIQRLGAINLAAIEEYQTTNERKEYLDKQQQDLVEALTILQNAIRKIDRETRIKFRETFDRINEQFQKLFPRIFGGGRGYLELTDDDMLSTGIIVKAQPPGKRNVAIHMLSGGEKALTAISLVFAMFQLNPAPFCILDEVDAPLDDMNVGRFCQLVKEMSKDTQFLIISHNKVTIEMADYLMGVTMQEPGVSRIVSVDMEEAIDMVEAA